MTASSIQQTRCVVSNFESLPSHAEAPSALAKITVSQLLKQVAYVMSGWRSPKCLTRFVVYSVIRERFQH